MTRMEDIDYDFLQSDRIWPPNFATPHFLKALVEVLKRLPDEAYDMVANTVSFVIEDSRVTAVNVPFKRVYPASSSNFEVQFYTIVVFHQALDFPHTALVGLLAHELAHTFVNELDYETDEKLADALVQRWGFDKELKAVNVELEKIRKKDPLGTGAAEVRQEEQ